MNKISTGFRSLDKALAGGLRRKNLTILAGPGGVGKTTLALNLAAMVADEGKTALFFSNRECRHFLLEKLIAREAGVARHIVADSVFAAKKEIVFPAAKVLASRIFIADGSLASRMVDIQGVAKKEVIPGHWRNSMVSPDLVIVDEILGIRDNWWYRSPEKFRSYKEHCRWTLKGLKALAVSTNSCVLGIVSLPRIKGKVPGDYGRALWKIFGEEDVTDIRIFMYGELSPEEHDITLVNDKGPRSVLAFDPSKSRVYEKIQGDLWMNK